MTKIKICGIQDPETAFFAATCQADWIGIMQVKSSKRYVSLECAKEISHAIDEGGAEGVLVYENPTLEEICKGVEMTGIKRVQIYGDYPEFLEELSYIHVNTSRPLRWRKGDVLLFDSSRGSGEKGDWEGVSFPKEMPWFLAGGLNADNVLAAIASFHPFGVDVSSGVEKEGKKDKQLIEQFIQEVKKHG